VADAETLIHTTRFPRQLPLRLCLRRSWQLTLLARAMIADNCVMLKEVSQSARRRLISVHASDMQW